MSKKRVVFDVAVLRQGVTGGGNGIFYTAYNLFAQMAKSEKIELVLYSSNGHVGLIGKWLEEQFSRSFKMIGADALSDTIYMLKLKRKEQAKKHQYIRKALYKLPVLGLKVVQLVRNCIGLKPKDVISGDVYFSPMDAIPEGGDAKHKFIVLYDAIPLLLPEYQDIKGDSWFSKMCASLPYATKCFAISQSCKDDFLKLFPEVLKPEQIMVTPLAASEKFCVVDNQADINRIKAKYNIPANKKYVLSLCTLEPRKNLIRAVKTFIEFVKKNKINDLVFVLGGGHWDEFLKKLEQEFEDLGEYKDLIVRAGYVEDGDMSALYSGAEWFVYTSQYEGFGLPPLEAMQCGTAVITSNNSSLPEVVGDAGIMIDFDSDEQHIAAYEKYWFDEKFKTQMAQKGLERAKAFSWDRCAQIMIDEMVK